MILLYFVVRVPTSIRFSDNQYACINTCIHNVNFKGAFILLIFYVLRCGWVCRCVTVSDWL